MKELNNIYIKTNIVILILTTVLVLLAKNNKYDIKNIKGKI